MKFQCIENLYWHQERGYSGFLNSSTAMDKKKGKLVFEKGKEYEMSVGFSGRNHPIHIYIFVISPDGRSFPILDDTLHGDAINRMERYFDISSAIV